MSQDRYTVSFGKKEEEQKLYKWVKEKAIILGECNFTKQTLYEKMVNEEKEKNNKNI